MNSQEKYRTFSCQLNHSKILREAESITGLSDFGNQGFIAPMTRFLDRTAREVDFSDEGLDAFRADIVRFLVNRLRTHDDIQKHPEILKEDVSDPVIIIGLPRSGTTKLQRMMAAAPDVQKLFLWRMLNPARFPDAISGQPDPRMALQAARKGDSIFGGSEETYQEAQAAHAMAMTMVEEEFILFNFILDESIAGFDLQVPLFNYSDWSEGKPDRETDKEAYRYVRTLLQYLQWQDGGKRNRPWILKTVFHVAHMDALLECFPRATFVHCHRDPRSTIPSVAKVMWAVWSMRANQVDKHFVGKGFLTWSKLATQRYLAARERLHLDDRIIDVEYDSIRSDIMPVIRNIYERAGWELTAEAELAMVAWEKGNEQGKHGKHAYSLEEFGLNEDVIEHHFSEYIRRFIRR